MRINRYSIRFMPRNKDSVDIFVVINKYHDIKYTYDEKKYVFE